LIRLSQADQRELIGRQLNFVEFLGRAVVHRYHLELALIEHLPAQAPEQAAERSLPIVGGNDDTHAHWLASGDSTGGLISVRSFAVALPRSAGPGGCTRPVRPATGAVTTVRRVAEGPLRPSMASRSSRARAS